MANTKKNPTEVVSKNIIKNYGLDSYAKLLRMFSDNASFADIGKEFKISRQRVYLWAKALGTLHREFIVNEDATRILNEQTQQKSE